MEKINAIANGPKGIMIKRNIYSDAQLLLNHYATKPLVLVDGGACQGSVINIFLNLWPKATIHAFEARPDLAKILKKKYHKRKKENVKVHNKALGNTNSTIEFNVTRNAGTGSTLLPSDRSKTLHGTKMEIVNKINIDCIRLDTFLTAIDYLKMDIQGSELVALEGCEKLFDKMKIITTEIMFYPAYDNQPLFFDIHDFLKKHNFKLFSLYNLWVLEDGRMGSGDALYVNNRFYTMP